MPLPLFLVAAIVLVVFGIIAAAGTGTLFGTAYIIWFMASLLSYYVHVLLSASWPAYYVRRSA